MNPQRSALAAAFFAFIFIVLSMELLADQRTYMQPPTKAEAQARVDVWLHTSGRQHQEDTQQTFRKNELVRYMTSSKRYQAHRVLLGMILLCYLASAFGIWRRYPTAYKLVILTFAIKISHSLFFLWMGYQGRAESAHVSGAPMPPLLVLGENETYHLLGIALSILLIVYFYWLHRKHKQTCAAL